MIENILSMKVKDINDYTKKILKEIRATGKVERIDEIISLFNNDKRIAINKMAIKIKKEIDKLDAEKARVKKMYDFDLDNLKGDYIAGVDEVGRGPLAGPIVSAAVVLDYSKLDNMILWINDSKKINASKRKILFEKIKDIAVDYKIVSISASVIDEKGISWCNNEVFKEAVLGLKIKVDKVLCDGYPIKDFNIESQAVIKGDTKSAAIACASILAKVYRDELMEVYSRQYPGYDFESNVGYGTAKHITGIKEHGSCEIHRMSFIKSFI